MIGPALTLRLGLVPAAVLGELAVWQPVTYMFLHDTGGLGHLLINMLALWMFGTELERTWGTRFFVKYYFVCGVGAALTTMALSILPISIADTMYYSVTVGASGAIYGLLLGYVLYFPNRPIFLYFIFPIPAKYFVMIVGAIAFFSSLGGPGGGIAHSAHLGGLIVGYVYLKGLRARPLDHALDIDRVAGIRAEQVARHAGAGDIPRDEGGRPGHVVEAAAVGAVDAAPVVVDALGGVALLDALLLGGGRLVDGMDDDLAAEAGPFADRQQHHRDLGAGRRRRRLGHP